LSHGQTFFYVGPSGGDFFDELNWNTLANGTGTTPDPNADPIPDSTTGAIALDLIIDGDTVDAAGQVDFGSGSLTLDPNSVLNITGAGNDLDINSSSGFSLTDAALTTNGDAVFEGIVNMSGGSVTSLTDDVEFQDNITLTVDGTSFTGGAGQPIFFDGFGAGSSITNASFTTTSRLGMRNAISVVMNDTTLDINNGGSDVDNVFAGLATGTSLTLNGTSSLLADSIEEDVLLILNDDATADLGGNLVRITADASTITLNSLGNVLTVQGPLDTLDPDYFDSRDFLIDGRSGVSYQDSLGVGWNITNWNGVDAVTLRLVPEPGSLMIALVCFAGALPVRRRR
jgi:hypothetical protein